MSARSEFMGWDIAVDSLRQVFADVRQANPALYAALGHAGMVCCRYARQSARVISNHAWGAAIDLKISGELDTRGDNMVFQGLLELYPYFHKYGWYWGAEYPTEDAMHFELADQTFARLWKARNG